MAKDWPRKALVVTLFAGLGSVPLLAGADDQSFYLALFSRMMIFGLAALGLNLILGFGGLVSLGHAMYLGIGVYTMGILAIQGVTSGWLHLAAALLVGAVVAVPIGLVCLRTGGVAFIMITLAFAQMLFYVAISLRDFGGDDGMAIPRRSDFGLLDLSDNVVFYYTILALLLAVLWSFRQLVESRFGMVLRASKFNPRRMTTLGFPTLRYQLTGYVISAEVCVLAGVLLANLTLYLSPSYMQWRVSGELVLMTILGGMTTLVGPVVGAVTLLGIEEVLGAVHLGLPWNLDRFINQHLMIFVGLFVIAVALWTKQGIYGYLVARKDQARFANAGKANDAEN